MNFILNIESETYPVEGLRVPTDAVRADELEGRSLYFVSPVRLPIGKSCSVIGDEVGYQVVVSGCFGFSYSLKFLVSGTIAGKMALANS